MQTEIKVEELLCLKVRDNNGVVICIPLDEQYLPCAHTNFRVLTNEAQNLTIIEHCPSEDVVALGADGRVVNLDKWVSEHINL